ncbi:unnamed protein product [Rotaria sp. Silwood2]|nr:unnamed protein product [Rotaria sp. Silwood2]
MNNNTRSHLNLQEYPISDLLYCSHSVCQQSKIDLLSQQTSLIPMPTLQSISELAEEPKTCDRMAQLDIKSNGQLALIQIQTIPSQLPSLLILIELQHLSFDNPPTYVKIKEFFSLVFRSGNELYSWGNMDKELDPAKDHHLFNWSILA